MGQLALVHDSVPLEELAMDYCLAKREGNWPASWKSYERMLSRIDHERVEALIKATDKTLIMIGLWPKEK